MKNGTTLLGSGGRSGMQYNSLIECEKVSKTYGIFRKNRALDNVSLNIKKGEIVCIVGPNGAGKSTLLKILANVIANYQGRISVFGKIRYVPENSVYFQNMTGKENLNYYAKIFGKTKADVIKIMEKLDLKDSKVIANGYSKGMKRKLDIAKAMIAESDILLMDEPFDGLEPKICDELISYIMELKSAGYSFIIGSHELSKVQKISDRIIFLNAGKIKTEESIVSNKYIYIEFEGEYNFSERIDDKSVEMIEKGENYTIIKIIEERPQWEVIANLISKGLKITSFSRESLESLYRRVYEK
ncbi:MAG: hypothetical protein B2I18_05865 [Cuniculiplasma sp. C_DKE]|nr:MAG: hypothetical protein B2I18_05865 [Cuniculiplasma sp. C_DKE]